MRCYLIDLKCILHLKNTTERKLKQLHLLSGFHQTTTVFRVIGSSHAARAYRCFCAVLFKLPELRFSSSNSFSNRWIRCNNHRVKGHLIFFGIDLNSEEWGGNMQPKKVLFERKEKL